jgi:hypothetical protein
MIAFDEAIVDLIEVGIEPYHADLVAGESVSPANGDFEEVDVHEVGDADMKLSAEGIEKAVRVVQRRTIALSRILSPDCRRGVRRLFR